MEWEVINNVDPGVLAWIGSVIEDYLGESKIAWLLSAFGVLSAATRLTKTEQDDKKMGKIRYIYHLLFDKTNAK